MCDYLFSQGADTESYFEFIGYTCLIEACNPSGGAIVEGRC